MDLENTNCDEVIYNRFKRCEFCGKELRPIGFDYLYVNISPDCIDYKRCTCNKAQEYWKEQHNCRMTKYWEDKTMDFYLLAHEYIFILKK